MCCGHRLERIVEGFFQAIISLHFRKWLPKPLKTALLSIYQTRLIYKKSLDPWRTIFWVYFPFPWHYPNPSPLSVEDLRVHAGTNFFYRRHETILLLRVIHIFPLRDTPIRSLYRLYDAIVTENQIETKHESTYIWDQYQWSLIDWPDTMDRDPLRYTILAAIIEDLVEAFNFRLQMGLCRDPVAHKKWQSDRAFRRARIPQPLESAPSWAAKVPPYPEKVVLILPTYLSMIDQFTRPPFKKRNIYASSGNLSFI